MAMIVSVSRRCDIPAWHMDAFMADLDAGFVLVPNPFDARKTRRVSLLPGEVDCLVFWTRDPRPILARESELRARGYPFIVQVTLTGYPRALEPGVPPAEAVAEAMRELAGRIGPRRLAWRYDPVMASAALDAAFHGANFARLAELLDGAAGRVILSLIDEYRATRGRLARAGYPEVVFASPREEEVAAGQARAGNSPPPPYPAILEAIGRIGSERGLPLQACAEAFDLSPYGIGHGACIDAGIVGEACGKRIIPGRDRGQRPACGCAPSVDIGSYGPCPAACAYCYARR